MVTDAAWETFADAVVAVVVELLLLLRLSTKLCIDIDDSSFEWSLELLSVRFLLLVDKTLLLSTIGASLAVACDVFRSLVTML